jgi:hypothetical protein
MLSSIGTTKGSINKGPGPGLGVLILPVNSWFPRIHMMSARSVGVRDRCRDRVGVGVRAS